MSDKTPEEARNGEVIRSLLQRIAAIGVHNLTAAKSAIVASLGIAAAAGYAYATDQNLPVKAPLPTFDQLDVHVYIDLSFMNDYVTVNGLFASRTGLTTHIVNGLIFDIYKIRVALSTTSRWTLGPIIICLVRRTTPSLGHGKNSTGG
jgi:hypothetical protein